MKSAPEPAGAAKQPVAQTGTGAAPAAGPTARAAADAARTSANRDIRRARGRGSGRPRRSTLAEVFSRPTVGFMPVRVAPVRGRESRAPAGALLGRPAGGAWGHGRDL